MKRPSFQFYPADWLSDPNVISMSPTQRGGYIQLLAFMWNTEDCSLKNDEDFLCKLSGLEPVDLRVVTFCFKQSLTNGQPTLRHNRLDKERKKQDEWREKSSNGGKKSAEKRWGTGSEIRVVKKWLQPNSNTSSSTSSSTSNKKEIIKKKTILSQNESALGMPIPGSLLPSHMREKLKKSIKTF